MCSSDLHEVRELVTAVLDELSLGERGRTVEVNVPPELPRVEIDLRLMRQAIKQVLDNAHKYSPADRPIRLTARAEPDAVVLSVQDFGPGIAEEERKLVFEKFYRGSREARNVPGTGLGLAIAKRIVEAGGGKIELESTVGAGSTFRFRLPVGKD